MPQHKSTRTRKAEALARERKQPESLFYLSFASGTGFLGAAVVRAHAILTAVQRCDELGINPGGEVACWPISKRDGRRVALDLRDRLLTAEEVIERLDGEPI